MEAAFTQTFQALADPTRRAILKMLGEGDMTAGDIAARFAMSAPSISHHLSVLKNAGHNHHATLTLSARLPLAA